MEYRSPLGLNFNLQKSQETAKEINETPKKVSNEEFIPFSSDSQPRGNFQPRHSNQQQFSTGRMRNSSGYDSSPSFGHRPRHSWNSPNQGHGPPMNNSFQNRGGQNTPITLYYHPAMVQDPWRDLQTKMNK